MVIGLDEYSGAEFQASQTSRNDCNEATGAMNGEPVCDRCKGRLLGTLQPGSGVVIAVLNRQLFH
ncbi:MAG: hypothetical protein ACFBSG_15190 [Leptolyngbyaceae cyanobacterium]